MRNTPRQFECTRLITAAQVKQVIQRVPGFAMASNDQITGNNMPSYIVSSGQTSSGVTAQQR